MLLKSKDFRDLNQPGSYEQPLRQVLNPPLPEEGMPTVYTTTKRT